jgi:hypothetical protein
MFTLHDSYKYPNACTEERVDELVDDNQTGIIYPLKLAPTIPQLLTLRQPK